MNTTDLASDLIVQDGLDTLKVCTVYSPNLVTAILVVPTTAPLRVRSYDATQVAQWRPATAQEYHRYLESLGMPEPWRAEMAEWRAEVVAWRQETAVRFDAIDRALEALGAFMTEHRHDPVDGRAL